MKVVIKKAQRYNDANNKAKFYPVGAELETKSWYAEELVKAGFAVYHGQEAVPTEPQPEPQPEPEPEQPQKEISATQSAKILAEQNGIDLSTVTGSGANGKITVGDVQALING